MEWKCIIRQIYFWYWLSVKLHWTKTTLNTSRFGTIFLYFVLSMFFVLSHNFIVSDVRHSSLIHLLFLTLICHKFYWCKSELEELLLMFHIFNDIFDIIWNIWHKIRTIWQFRFFIPSWSFVFSLLFLYCFLIFFHV